MSYEMNIKKIKNGFIVEMHSDEESLPVIEVIEEIETASDGELFRTNDEEKMALGKLLIRVAEYFGMQYDKFSNNNLSITFNKKGGKLED
jgi:hypothetical protein